MKHKFRTFMYSATSLLLLFLLPHHCLSTVDILHIQLHDPCDNMTTWCADCCVWNGYRNDSVYQPELRFSNVSHMFFGSHSVCWPWLTVILFSVLLPSSTDACSARRQQEATDTTHVQLVVSSWNDFSKASLFFIESKILDYITYNRILLYVWTNAMAFRIWKY